MPKGNSGAEDRAKVKLRVIEFELEGGNASVENSIRQLTTALQNRPIMAKTIPTRVPKELANGADSEPEEIEDEAPEEFIEGEPVEIATNGTSAKKPRVRKPKPPEYKHDLDMTGTGGPTFKDFAKEKAPTTRQKQYLVAAFWLKEYGGSPTVNADKMYTLFKTAGWSTNFNNWRTAFDNLVHSEHMRLEGKGEFAINPLGEDVVTKGTEV